MGKVTCVNSENSSSFFTRKEGVIAGEYNIDEIEMRILNIDAVNWIKRSITYKNVHFQLDIFHRNKAILTYVSIPEVRKIIYKLLYAKEIDTLLGVIEAYSNSANDEKECDTFYIF